VTAPRHFPPPWTPEDNGACFIVTLRVKRFSRSGFLRRRTACSGTSGDGDRKQSAKNRTAGVSGDVVPNG